MLWVKCFFVTLATKIMKSQSIIESNKYLSSVLKEFNAEYFDSGNADIDIIFALKCKVFVQGRGYFSKLIVELRKLLGLKNIECETLK